MGLFDRLKKGLSKTREAVVGRLGKIVGLHTAIDDSLFDEMEEALIAADVGVAPSSRIISNLRARVRRDGLTDPAGVLALLKEEVAALLPADQDGDPFHASLAETPHVIMVVGVNGVGKTTTIGKLAYQYREAGKRVLIAAADTFRAAANEQLEIWTKRAGVEILRQSPGADPGAVAFDAVKHAQAASLDVVIVDTAGRLHTKSNLMEELKKIRRVIAKVMPTAPQEVLLVLDGTTGQNAIQQARQFNAAAGVTGIVLTKLDGTAKGGVVIGVASVFSIPVRYIGVGEAVEDLQPFNPHAFVDALFAQDERNTN